ncbi:MAG: ATP-binding cassette domain-containing protein [Mollicutes bacterium]|nr:ATP-binding cassette domain-containing protein [Mollicutes bacterium]
MRKKIIVVNQKDTKDCGPCCLQSIIRYHGGYVSIERIRDDAFTTTKGTSIYHLVEASKKYGLGAIAKKYLDKNISHTKLPVIAYIKNNNGYTHYVCVYGYNSKYVTIMDPAKGINKMEIDSFNDVFTGIVIEFSPTDHVIYLSKGSSIYSLITAIIKDNKKIFISVVLCSFLIIIFTIINNIFIKVIFKYLFVSDFNLIKILFYIFLINITFKIFYEYIRNYYINHLNKNIDIYIIRDFLSHLINLPFKTIKSHNSGEILSRFNEIKNIKDLFGEILISVFLDYFLAFSIFIILCFINYKMALLLVLIVIIYFIYTIIENKYLYERTKHNNNLQIKLNNRIIDNINMLESIKNLNNTQAVLNDIEQLSCNYLYDNYLFVNLVNTNMFLKKLFVEVGTYLISVFGFILIYKKQLSFVDFITFNNFSFYITYPIKTLPLILIKYNFIKTSFNKIMGFIDLEEENIVKDEKFVIGNILYKNVTFSYDNYHIMFKNFNLEILNGSKIMIKGKSGCGKSTLCKMLCGINVPCKGLISINGKNIRDYNIYTLRKHITYVGQNDKLYSDSIKNNILFYEKANDLFDIVCKICLIDEIVSKKTFRYEEIIDNYSQNISGGERQRIVLARALLRNRNILIIDEALSETDYITERRIIENIITHFKDKTLIYVTHKNQDNLFERIINLESNSEL